MRLLSNNGDDVKKITTIIWRNLTCGSGTRIVGFSRYFIAIYRQSSFVSSCECDFYVSVV